MKRFLALVALVLGLASCQTEPEGLNVNVGGEQETYVTVSLPETTRANSALGAFENVDLNGTNGTDYTVRYIFEVYYGETGVQKQVLYSDDKSVSFPVRLVPGRDYNFVAWADIAIQPTDSEKMNKALAYEGNTTDVYYDTSNLEAIEIIDAEWNAMDETRDAYTGFHNTKGGEKYTGSSSINIRMTRPFAKLRVITTDMEQLNDLNIIPTRATVQYTTQHYASFNAFAGGVNENDKMSKTHTNFAIKAYDDNVNDKSKVLFTDYFFAKDDQDVVNFTLTVYDQRCTEQDVQDDYIIKSNNFNTPIPAHRNNLTTISGKTLTDGNNIEVTVYDAFENVDDNGNTTDPDYDYTTISSEKEFMDAIDEGGNYILISDINITGVSATSLAATRTTGTTTTTTINLNGYTITLKADVEIPADKTVIINNDPVDNAGNDVGAIVSNGGAIVNNGTLNIEGGHFGANTIENNNGVGEVNITGGTFESDPSDFVDDDYKVVENEENGEFTIEQKEEAVEINGTKYRSIKKAVAAAQNGETVKFILDVEQEDGILITDKNITIDLNDKTFTVTNGANTNNRNFKVNGTSVVTIKNGTMVAAGDYTSGAYGTVRTEGTANVTLEKVNLYNYRGNGLNIKALTGTTVTINNTNIYSVYGGGIEAAGGTVVLNNVMVDQQGMYTAPYNSMAISVNGGGQAIVNSGTYSTKCLTAEEANNQGTSHGPWCAGVLNSGGTLIINGGTFSNDNFGDNALATYGRGLLLADTGANIQINGGTFNAVKAIIDVTNNLGDASKNPSATISGGTFSADPRISGLYASELIKIADGSIVNENNGSWTVGTPIAKVGDTAYCTIDMAIANWTNNTTLTLLADVTLSNVIEISSTEYRVLDLGTYTMTAASKKDAIQIVNNGRSSASHALDIKADATNPGGITATGKAVVKTTGKSGVKDRPIIRFYNGVLTGTNVVYHSGSNGTNCPQFWFYGGVFNGTIYANRALFQFYGGTFNGSLQISVDSSAYALISGGKFKYLSNLYGSALKSDKFTIGSSKGKYDRGIYVDNDGYFVVGGAVITEFGDMFAAKVTKTYNTSEYLFYSSAAEYGLYYTNAAMAGNTNVEFKE